ncbi:hypothetical protein CBR_g12681 [Chara braunii]|uniref:Right handed beta helix domain-containing protein n=1 Tax=Chara braunii TaxID=69332 RepID=A0A388KSH4_CHABU|nr:hypothetical protein CBR_g12681 [Chara braunii]|eukprot:GBG72962.1 hypothetical protein CBR_g12681 [Chara braunii]
MIGYSRKPLGDHRPEFHHRCQCRESSCSSRRQNVRERHIVVVTPLGFLTTLLWGLASLVILVEGRTFYVSSEIGRDSFSEEEAQDPRTPWATLDRVRRLFLERGHQPGDQILFQRGGVFRGGIDLSHFTATLVNVTFAAYGNPSLPRPRLTGSILVDSASWQKWGPSGWGIYVAQIPSQPSFVGSVFIDGQRLMRSRWPNQADLIPVTGAYARYDSCNSTTKEIFAPYAGSRLSGYWVGAELVYRSTAYMYTKGRVTSFTVIPGDSAGGATTNGETVAFGLDLSSRVREMRCIRGAGFFLQDHLGELDSPGEYFYDSTFGNLYVWNWDSQSPVRKTVEITVTSTGIGLFRNIDCTISNLSLDKYQHYGVRVVTSTSALRLVVSNLVVEDVNGFCIDCSSWFGVCSNNVVRQCGHTGISMQGSNNFVQWNNISEVGLLRGEHLDSAPPQGIGTGMYNRNTTIQFNTVAVTGYMGINFPGGGSVTRFNYVSDTCLILNDCGSIYQPYVQNASIARNIITRSWGNEDSLPVGMNHPAYDPYRRFGEICVYIDNNATGITVAGNTVMGCSTGVFNHGGNFTLIVGNTFFDTRRAVQFGGLWTGYNSTVERNIIYLNPGGTVSFYEREPANEPAQYIRNTICSPYKPNAVQVFNRSLGNRQWGTKDCAIDNKPAWNITYQSKNLITPALTRVLARMSGEGQGWVVIPSNVPLEFNGPNDYCQAQPCLRIVPPPGCCDDEQLRPQANVRLVFNPRLMLEPGTQYLVLLETFSSLQLPFLQLRPGNVLYPTSPYPDEVTTTTHLFSVRTRTFTSIELLLPMFPNDTVYIKKAGVYEVSYSRFNPPLEQLLINPSHSKLFVTLPKEFNYSDIYGNILGESVMIGPWSSEIIYTLPTDSLLQQLAIT